MAYPFQQRALERFIFSSYRGLVARLNRGEGRVRFPGLEDMQEPRYRTRRLGVQQKLLSVGGVGVAFYALEHPGFDASQRAADDVVFRHDVRQRAGLGNGGSARTMVRVSASVLCRQGRGGLTR